MSSEEVQEPVLEEAKEETRDSFIPLTDKTKETMAEISGQYNELSNQFAKSSFAFFRMLEQVFGQFQQTNKITTTMEELTQKYENILTNVIEIKGLSPEDYEYDSSLFGFKLKE